MLTHHVLSHTLNIVVFFMPHAVTSRSVHGNHIHISIVQHSPDAIYHFIRFIFSLWTVASSNIFLLTFLEFVMYSYKNFTPNNARGLRNVNVLLHYIASNFMMLKGKDLNTV